MQAVILAAGKGLRLRPFTEKHPKPLIPIANKPLLKYTLETLPDSITEIIVVIGYLGQQIQDYLGNEWNGKPIKYVVQETLLGTGDALLQAKDLVEQNFLVVNGDDLYSKDDLTELLKYPYSILGWESTVPYPFGLSVTEDMQLVGFDPKSALLNCGAYHLTKDFFKDPLAEVTVHDKTEYSLPHTLVNIAQHEKVMVVPATHWFPVGTPAQHIFADGYYVRKLAQK
ncbi:MAG TPA: sugar phosphate nucleotidyltransferase [Patescibacteria group bacterium]|jgi:bifunctional UDP-N-acetylglucosamine pyrophosphorylase/glucosamine-1-phosphate N-acetyltransferase|nr:sugar phosphate nucleotidyltransferase [Patescibacteria group bacterium]